MNKKIKMRFPQTWMEFQNLKENWSPIYHIELPSFNTREMACCCAVSMVDLVSYFFFFFLLCFSCSNPSCAEYEYIYTSQYSDCRWFGACEMAQDISSHNIDPIVCLLSSSEIYVQCPCHVYVTAWYQYLCKYIATSLNPLCAELVWGNIKIDFCFLSFYNTAMAQVIPVLPHGRQGPVYPI